MQPQINTAADDAVGKEVKTAMCRHLKSKERNEKILQWGALLNVVRCILDTEQMSLVHVCKSTFSPLQYVYTAGKSSLNLAFSSLMWPYIWCYWSEQCKWFFILFLFCLILFQIRPKPLWYVVLFQMQPVCHITPMFWPHWKLVELLVEEGLSRSDDAVPGNRRLVDEAGWKPLERKQNCIHFVTIVSLSSAQQPKKFICRCWHE